MLAAVATLPSRVRNVRWLKRWVAVAVLSMSTVLAGVGASYGQDKVVRIGFQKYGKLVLLKTKATLEDKLKAAGYRVVWTEFPSGPPLLEALNVGAIDFGNAGEAPPIFAQAAGAPLVYVAYEPPAPHGEAIVVPKDSKLNSVADLRGKKVALNKGSNVHYLLLKVLDKAGVKYSEIQPTFLAPADARAAFERGAVDAWAIWDPFLAAAEAATGARTLSDGTGIVANYQFYLASRKFLENNPGIVDLVLAELGTVDDWAKGDIHAVAEQLGPAVGLPVPIVEVALRRQSYGIKPVTEKVIADQQQVADAFFALCLIPKPIKISDAARRPGT
jgi:sulfonate transport system substrate-binding protein